MPIYVIEWKLFGREEGGVEASQKTTSIVICKFNT